MMKNTSKRKSLFKRILSALVATAMCAGMMPAVWADGENTDQPDISVVSVDATLLASGTISPSDTTEGGDNKDVNTEGGDTKDANTEGEDTKDANTEGEDTKDANTEGEDNKDVNTEGGDKKDANTEGEDTKDANTEGEDNKGVNTEGEDNKDVNTEGGDNKDVNTEGGDNKDVNTEGGDNKDANTEGEDTKDANTEGEDTKDANTEGEDTQGANTESEDNKDANTEGRSNEAVTAEGGNDEESLKPVEVPEFPVNGTEEEQQKWYQDFIDRITQTPGLDTSTGEVGDIPSNPEQPSNWTVFYDEKTGTYQLTYEIDEEAEGDQTVDLTKALELLNQYANAGRQELWAEKDKIEKPVKENVELPPRETVSMTEPAPPEAPSELDVDNPGIFTGEEPEKPGMPAGMDEILSDSYEGMMQTSPPDPVSGEPTFDTDKAFAYLVGQGLNKDDAYTKMYAEYLYEKAYCDWVEDNWPSWVQDDKFGFVSHFGDKDTLLYYGCGISVKFEGGMNGTPILNEPEYKVPEDKITEYEIQKAEYDAAKKAYDEALAVYTAALEKWTAENDTFKEELQKYKADKAAYDAEVARVNKANYDAMQAYNKKKAEIAEKYAHDREAYYAKIKELEDQFYSQMEANVLQPGDIRKFEINITTKSGHTYKYKDGSFTLATPKLDEIGDSKGFDGQTLGTGDNGHTNLSQDYSVSAAMKPIRELLENAGLLEDDVQRETKMGHDTFKDILEYIGNYCENGDTAVLKVLDVLGVEYTREDIGKGYMPISYEFDGSAMTKAVENYLVSYYSKLDGKSYQNIDEVFMKSTAARSDVTSSENVTQTDKGFTFGNGQISVTYNESFEFNNFYQALLSFAYGAKDENGNVLGMDIDKVLGDKVGIGSNGHPEYDHNEWSNKLAELGLDYSVALEQYMSHQTAWNKANDLFNQLLEKGLSVKDATTAAFTMAINLDGELTSNNWQLTKWGWYNSLQLEQMDYNFNLEKVDQNGNTIANSETGFQLWYLDVTVDADGQEIKTPMYCHQQEKRDTEGNLIGYDYVFNATESVIYTDNGVLNITETLLKDVVYFLQEKQAPAGHRLDDTVHVIIDEKAIETTDWDQLAKDAGVELACDENGIPTSLIKVSTDKNGVPYIDQEIKIVNVRLPDPDSEDPDPEDPDPEDPTPDDPDPEDPDPEDPTVEIPDEPTPLTDIPDELPPLANQPQDDLIDIFDEDVPLAGGLPTGNEDAVWYLLAAFSLMGLGLVKLLQKKSEAK